MPKDSPILSLMREVGAPLTRDEYLRFNNLGKSTKVTPEEEVELPNRFQYPVVTHEELPKPKSAASGKGEGKTLKKTPIKHFNGKTLPGTTQGAPVDFGGQVMPNPKGLQPMADTDNPPARPLAGAKMDISNPEMNQLEPAPEREQ